MQRLNQNAPGEGETRPHCLPFGRSRRHCAYFPATTTRFVRFLTKRPPAVYVSMWLYSAAELPKSTAV